MKFLRKTLCFTKFHTFMNLFGHWAKNFQSFVLLCSSAGPSKKQPMRPEVVCDEKQKVSNVSKKGVFSWLFTDYDRKSLHFRKKVILLVLKSLFYVSRGTFSEKIKIFVSKSSFSFVKSCWALSQIISDFWGSCFRQGFHHSVLLLPRKVSGKKFSKKVFFFIVSRLGAKNRLLNEHQDECENFILRVRWRFFRKNILFKVIWYIFSCISSEEL